MVWADIAHLDYLRARMSDTRHAIVPVAYDLQERVVWIADNDRAELQRCALSSLAAARQAEPSPDPARHRLFDFDWREELPPAQRPIRAAMQTAVGNRQADGPAVFGLAGSHRGPAGVAAFAADYAAWPDAAPGGQPRGAARVDRQGRHRRSALSRVVGRLPGRGSRPDRRPPARTARRALHADRGRLVQLADEAKQRRHADAIDMADRLAQLEATGLQLVTRRLLDQPQTG